MTLVLSSALGSALVLAALAKIPTSARRTPFLQGLGVSRRWSNALTDSGMVLEGGLGVCLIANIASPGSTVVAATTGAAFLAVQIAARVRGVHVPCNCFGVLDQAGHSWFEITRAAAFFGLALTLVALHPWNSPSGLQIATLVGAATGAGGLIAVSSDLLWACLV